MMDAGKRDEAGSRKRAAFGDGAASVVPTGQQGAVDRGPSLSTGRKTGGVELSEVAFIDPDAPDVAALLAGLRPEVRGIVLTAYEPAPTQMIRVLRDHRALTSVHVIAHGSPGQVHFSSGTLTAENLARHAGELAEIGRSIGERGQLALWSCETGRTEHGRHFAAMLSSAAGVPVATATGLVGASHRGGSWHLDASSEELAKAQPPLSQVAIAAYEGVLPGTLAVWNRISGQSITNFGGSSSGTTITSGETIALAGTFTIATTSGNPAGAGWPQTTLTVTLGFYSGTTLVGTVNVTVPVSPTAGYQETGTTFNSTSKVGSISISFTGLTIAQSSLPAGLEGQGALTVGVYSVHDSKPTTPNSAGGNAGQSVASLSALASFQTTDAACFAEGTRIATPDGNVAVESLREGDIVRTASGGSRSVRWVGHRALDLTRHIEPGCAQPIRISAGAFGDNIPTRDLRLSPDHAVLLDGVLVPAKLLRNDMSIVRETDCRTVTYYHIELDSHDILLAEGLEAESYLDTGNRTMFANSGQPMRLHPVFDNDQARREAESCAPLATDAERVQPLWQALADRARRLGYTMPETAITTDAEVCILSGGRRVDPVSRDGGRYIFLLPEASARTQLVSRSVVPNQQIPWIDDHRLLGARIGRVTVTTDGVVETIALDDPRLEQGWWDVEIDDVRMWRWTNGCANLPLTGLGPVRLEIEIDQVLAYPVTANEAKAEGARRAA